MNIYKYVPDSDKYDCLDNMQDWDVFWTGTLLAPSWTPISVPYYARYGQPSDFPHLCGPLPVFSKRAWHALQPLISKAVEALPLICDTEMIPLPRGERKIVPAGPFGPYFAINVLDIVDCLDHDRSEITLYSNGAVMMVDSYAFKAGCLKDKHILKLPETRDLEVLVSEQFKNVVETNKLQGLKFPRVGSSE